MLQTKDDEINIFNLFKIFWDSKLVISSFVILALLLGTGFYYDKKPIHLSKLTFSIDSVPPFYKLNGKTDTHRVLADFQKLFYSANIFESWKNINKNTLIKYEGFSKTKIIDGIILENSDSVIKINLDNKNKNDFFLIIKSNNLKFLDDVYNYFIYVNNLLNSNYRSEAFKALSIIKKEIDLLSKLEKNKLDFMATKIYLMKTEYERGPFTIDRPTIPETISPKLGLILSLSLILGVVIGCFYVIFYKIVLNKTKV